MGSDGSEGTGDELQGHRHERQRQSLRTHKLKSQLKQRSVVISPPMSDGDFVGSPPGSVCRCLLCVSLLMSAVCLFVDVCCVSLC